MNDMPRVSIVIVNYNAGQLLSSNLCKIMQSVTKLHLNIIVVDNYSTDNSIELLKDFIDSSLLASDVCLIESKINGGFAYGNNLGIKKAVESNFNPDYFYLLNPDAVPESGAIEEAVKQAKDRFDCCIVGSQMLDEEGNKAASAFRFPSIISEFNRGAHVGLVDRFFPQASLVLPTNNTTVMCDWVCGAGFLIPIKTYEQLGEMDEKYFLYYEEVDYMKRARKLGIPVLVTSESKVVHIAGVSTGIVGGKVKKSSIPVYWYQSWHRFFFKNHSKSKALMCGVAWIAGRIINNMLAYFIKKRKPTDGHSIVKFWSYAILGNK